MEHGEGIVLNIYRSGGCRIAPPCEARIQDWRDRATATLILFRLVSSSSSSCSSPPPELTSFLPSFSESNEKEGGGGRRKLALPVKDGRIIVIIRDRKEASKLCSNKVVISIRRDSQAWKLVPNLNRANSMCGGSLRIFREGRELASKRLFVERGERGALSLPGTPVQKKVYIYI